MNWTELKEKIYYLDGSLRDIYVKDIIKEDWKNWIDLVNNNYRTSFYTYETEIKEDKIDFSKILEYWNGNLENSSIATIYIENIELKTYFFSDQELENDISPKEFNSIEDHNNLLRYMTDVSMKLGKKVILTAENMPEDILISVERNEIRINL